MISCDGGFGVAAGFRCDEDCDGSIAAHVPIAAHVFVFAVFACTLSLTFGEGSAHSRKLELDEQRILDRLKLQWLELISIT